jgi:hypothetical protein
VTVPIVPLSKIVNYLLDLSSEDGHPKAKFFMNGGFSRERPEELTQALQRHFLANPPTTKKPDNFGGVRITIDAPLPVPDGRAPMVRTVWKLDEGETVPRFITAYPVD